MFLLVQDGSIKQTLSVQGGGHLLALHPIQDFPLRLQMTDGDMPVFSLWL